MAKPEPLYRWKWNGMKWYEKPYYVLACRWCYGVFEASRSDAVTGGVNCRRALARYNRALVNRGATSPAGRYVTTLERFSAEGKECVSIPALSQAGVLGAT